MKFVNLILFSSCKVPSTTFGTAKVGNSLSIFQHHLCIEYQINDNSVYLYHQYPVPWLYLSHFIRQIHIMVVPLVDIFDDYEGFDVAIFAENAGKTRISKIETGFAHRLHSKRYTAKKFIYFKYHGHVFLWDCVRGLEMYREACVNPVRLPASLFRSSPPLPSLPQKGLLLPTMSLS